MTPQLIFKKHDIVGIQGERGSYRVMFIGKDSGRRQVAMLEQVGGARLQREIPPSRLSYHYAGGTGPGTR